MSEITKEELMLCSQEKLIELVLRYQKMLHEVYEAIDELTEALGVKGDKR